MLAVCLVFVIVIVFYYYITLLASFLYCTFFVTTRLFVRSFSVCTDQDINKWLIGKGVLEATIHFDRSYYYYVVSSYDVAFYYCFLPPPFELCAVVVALMLPAPLETDHRLVVVMLDDVSDRYAVAILFCFIPFVLLSLYLRPVAIRQPFFVSLSLYLQPVAIRQSFFVLLASFYCAEAVVVFVIGVGVGVWCQKDILYWILLFGWNINKHNSIYQSFVLSFPFPS